MQTIYIDVSRKAVLPTISAKQGDVGRKFKIVFTDAGLPYDLTGNLLSVFYSGDSGEGNYTHIAEKSAFEISGNSVIVELITQMLDNPGNGLLCLVMSRSTGETIGTWNIEYSVEAVPGADSEAAQDYYTAFSQAAQELATYSNEAKKSAGDAAQSATEAEQYAAESFEAAQNAFSAGPGIAFVLRSDGSIMIETQALDYIANQGTTGIWTWRKWVSGEAECWGKALCSGVGTVNAWGSLYVSTPFGGVDYPFAFIQKPCQVIWIAEATSSFFLVSAAGVDPGTTTNTGGWYFARPTKMDSENETVYMNIFVKGRWK